KTFTMNTILFDGSERNGLLPFTFTKPVAELRIGILTLREKWEKFLEIETSTQTEDYLSEKWTLQLENENLFINPAYLPNPELIKKIQNLKLGEKLVKDDEVIAFVAKDFETKDLKSIDYKAKVL